MSQSTNAAEDPLMVVYSLLFFSARDNHEKEQRELSELAGILQIPPSVIDEDPIILDFDSFPKLTNYLVNLTNVT
jgi:hypothetical protein